MILKGSQRSGGGNLAAHLMNREDNEHVHVHQVRGFASENLRGAFKEIEAISRGTRCRQFMFSLSLSPPETECVDPETFERAIDRIEAQLGLTDQPRVIVFHEKAGRRHGHCVWSRIDSETMTAKPLPFFKNRLQEVSRDLYLEHKWIMPRGMMRTGERNPANFDLADWQRAKRQGIDPRWTKEALQECWAASDGRQAFERSLEERGFILAKGDRCGFVVMDYEGEIYSLARMLGLKAKELRARLGDADDLRGCNEARKLVADRLTPTVRQHIQDARVGFKSRMAALSHNRAIMANVHRDAREKLRTQHEAREIEETRRRAEKLPRGFRGIWARITGGYAKICRDNGADAEKCTARDKHEWQSAVDGQLKERQSLQIQVKAARKEQANLLAELRRDLERLRSDGRLQEMPQDRKAQRRKLSPD